MMQRQKISIVYIVGRGHSGSTLLELMLGAHPAISSLGELKWLSQKKKSKGKNRDERCSCGALNIRSCSFWLGVDTELRAGHGLSLDSLDLRAVNSDTLVQHNRALFESLRNVTGTDIFVDSSKSHERLQQLKWLGDEIDIYPVYIVRDACGVVYSHAKRGRGLKHWARKYRANSKATHEILSGGRYHIVEYENLVREPGKTLSILASYIGLPENSLSPLNPVDGQHIIAGNSMKLSADLEINPDMEWKKALSLRQKLIVRWHTIGHILELRKLRKG